jgi:hypothetical protein
LPIFPSIHQKSFRDISYLCSCLKKHQYGLGEKPIADLGQKLQEMKELAKGRNIDLSSDIESQLEEKKNF